ncbi:hypothetical protein AHiyo1_49650 [Arthrobacter sp. Hiyo1]|uniref:hypothetical protein n=1 Tax=Arthrobacter sp. Hiyo1 TaxID=1588020 RepID=UPI0006A37F55|nr:hypothetical protein [Arthrobacter sp. Hiyo1]GAP61279.1 hypothetical protein AHiyo1_49650 [Arthrobacter sp. Hiyo1]
MWTELDNQGFENEEDYLKSLKKEDSYTFSYPFEYIAKNHGNDKYDIDMATMEVRVEWSDFQVGYVISYSVPDMYKIDPAQGNSDAKGFYDYQVYDRLLADLSSVGIESDVIAT